MSDLVARARAAYIESWRVHIKAAGGEVIEGDRLFTGFTGAPGAWFNPTITIAEGFAGALPAIEEEYRRRGIAFGFLADERFKVEAIDAARRLGLHANETRPHMGLHPIPDLAAPGADVRVVADAEALEQHILVQAAGFGSDPGPIRQFMPPSVLDGDEIYYLAWNEGIPAATATLVLTPPDAGIYAVSTHPDHRLRGLGTAVTVAAIRDATCLGCDLVSLQASPMGYPVYLALGFRTLEEQRTFVREAPEPGP